MAEESAGNEQAEDGKKKPAISIVRVRVWLEAARRAAGVERVDGRLVYEQLATAYSKVLTGTRASLGKSDIRFYRYAEGEKSPNKNTVERVDAVWPRTRDAYMVGPFEGVEPQAMGSLWRTIH